MPESGRITIIKRFTYRDQLEEWSNTYYFRGTKPSGSGSWKSLADAIILAEKPFLTGNTKFVRAYGYDVGAIASEWTHNYLGPPDTAQLGSITWAATEAAPGDAALVVRWFTGRYNSKGKKIYCRKYFHDVVKSNTDPDEVGPGQKSFAVVYAAKMIDGTLPGAVSVSDRFGSILTDPVVMPYITTRTLKRRGKRPPP